MACPCNGSWPSPQLLWGPGGALPPGAAAFQVRPFEPAFMTPGPVFAAMPYSPAVVAAVSPPFVGPATAVVPGVGAAAAAVGAAATGVELVTPGLPVGPRCAGCCGRAYSPLPPNAVQAWGSVLGCGGTCATCQWRSV